jgi:cell division protein FtsZ
MGVGGGGSNAVNHMIGEGIYGVDFVAINTDALTLSRSRAPSRVCIGEKATHGTGTGGNPKLGTRAAYESMHKLKAAVEGTELLFLTAGMGGGTGTGAAPVIAKIAQELGILTIAVVTQPFIFEGNPQARIAEAGIQKLQRFADTLIVIPNDRLLDLVGEQTSLDDAFSMADKVLYQVIQAISELVTTPGLINLDYADLRAVMAKAGPAFIAVGRATGGNRAQLVAKQATYSPLLEMRIDGASSVLVNVTAGPDLNMEEIKEATALIKKKAGPDANVIFGTVLDERAEDEMRMTVIATGFDRERLAATTPSASSPHPTSVAGPQPDTAEFNTSGTPPSNQTTEPPQHKSTVHDYLVPAFLRNAERAERGIFASK